MKINDAIRVLWKEGYFKGYKSTSEVTSKLLDQFGITCANVSMQLTSCSAFLRKTNSGWIQKSNYGYDAQKKSSIFDSDSFCQELRDVSEELFLDGHFAYSVFEAYKLLNNLVKEKTQLDDDGKSLMLKVFNENRPILQINNLKTKTEINEQEGFKFLMTGAMLFIRNPKAHENFLEEDERKAIVYLALANIFIEKIKKAKFNTFTS